MVWALAPAAIWIGQPIVVFYAGSTFVEPLLTLFATAAALAFARWREDRAPAWLMASGALAGWAAATKYLGLYLIAALALAVAWEARRGARRRALVSFAVPAAVTGAPWYALIWALSGNPVFPFFARLFGESEWSGAAAVARSGLSSSWAAGGLDLLRLGWDLVADRGRVGLQPPASPLVVAALRDLAQRALALRRSAAALASLAPVFLVVCGLATGPGYALWRIWKVGPPPVAPAAIDAFLCQRVPLYRALLFRRAMGLQGVPLYALHGERLHDFGGAALLGDWSGPYRYQLVLPLLDRPPELARELRRLGAAQLLLPRALVAPGLVAGIAASPRFRELYRDAEGVLFALD